MKYVNAYAVSRAYGGPEEGGWWYDIGVPLASVPVHVAATDAEIEEIKHNLERVLLSQDVIAPHEIEGVDRFSMCGNGDDLVICIEEETAKVYPDRRPHYE